MQPGAGGMTAEDASANAVQERSVVIDSNIVAREVSDLKVRNYRGSRRAASGFHGCREGA